MTRMMEGWWPCAAEGARREALHRGHRRRAARAGITAGNRVALWHPGACRPSSRCERAASAFYPVMGSNALRSLPPENTFVRDLPWWGARPNVRRAIQPPTPGCANVSRFDNPLHPGSRTTKTNGSSPPDGVSNNATVVPEAPRGTAALLVRPRAPRASGIRATNAQKHRATEARHGIL